MENIISQINTANYADNTKHDYKVSIRKYFQWLIGYDEETGEFPDEVRWIKPENKKTRLLPEALISEEELNKLAQDAENLRGCAFVLLDYESGGRIGEILSCLIKHVTFDKYGSVLLVDGKTGPMRIRLISCVPALAQWLSVHPFRNDPNPPLWVGLGTVGRNEPLSYNGARAMLGRLVKKAGLNKRIYSHLMRQSRATELATFLTDAQMDEVLGWVQGSDRTATYAVSYTHLTLPTTPYV